MLCTSRRSTFEQRGDKLKGFDGLLPENQGHSLALTVMFVLCSLDNGQAPSMKKGAF